MSVVKLMTGGLVALVVVGAWVGLTGPGRAAAARLNLQIVPPGPATPGRPQGPAKKVPQPIQEEPWAPEPEASGGPEAAGGTGSETGATVNRGDFPRRLAVSNPWTTGVDVLLLQTLLTDWGFYDGPADGIFGPATSRAVALFQVTHGSLANGSLDEGTLDDLLSTAAPPAKGKTNRAAWTPKPKPVGQDLRLVIDTDARTLTVLVEGEPYQQYPVAVGRPSLPTPHGDFFIKVKDIWGGGFGARWMQLSVPWGVYGVHGTNNPGSIGSYASHGCVRMFNRQVIELFSWVEVGTPVKIVGKPVRHWGETPRLIGDGICGTDVVRVQEALTDLGLYKGTISGRFNAECIKAVKELQKANGLRVTGEVDAKTWHLLGY
jgi:peptidoglycan hydrolase-like protein with peptidoglycan-binding domain